MAGGVALNCVAIGELVRSGIFNRVWVQPAAGDAGGALGAALLVSHSRFGVPRRLRGAGKDRQRGSYLGPRFSSLRKFARFLIAIPIRTNEFKTLMSVLSELPTLWPGEISLGGFRDAWSSDRALWVAGRFRVTHVELICKWL